MQKLFIGSVIVLMLGAAFSLSGFAQARASSSASTDGPVRATVGTFVLEEGSRIAFELRRSDPCPCMCGDIFVTGMSVVDRAGKEVYRDEVDSVPYTDWTGMWDLSRADGTPVAPGEYTILIRTSLGEFRAEVKIVPPGEESFSGRLCATASVCGLGLDVYHLVTKDDDGKTIPLRAGDKVMIALPGNPTTGYEWTGPDALPAGVLEPIPGVNYRPESGLIGAGGTFLFRYAAIGPGRVELSFSYRRPWEEAPASDSFSIVISVGGV